MWEVAREAHPDIPGEEETDIGALEEWLARDMRGAGDRPEAVFVALDGGEVVGYAKLSLLGGDAGSAPIHDLTGVKRAHRGRGIAAALKRRRSRGRRNTGYATLQTSNEVRNEPIRRLNERHGYVLEPGEIVRRAAG